jgi:hypothetical protein
MNALAATTMCVSTWTCTQRPRHVHSIGPSTTANRLLDARKRRCSQSQRHTWLLLQACALQACRGDSSQLSQPPAGLDWMQHRAKATGPCSMRQRRYPDVTQWCVTSLPRSHFQGHTVMCDTASHIRTTHPTLFLRLCDIPWQSLRTVINTNTHMGH